MGRIFVRYIYSLSIFCLLIVAFPQNPQADFVVFSVPIFNFIQSDYVPHSNEITNTISLFASPGEYEPTSFAVYTELDLNNLLISSSDLSDGSGSIIPKTDIDLRIVKIWLQGGTDQFVTNPQGIPVPELLVYNDQEPLHGAYVGTHFIPPNYSQSFHTSILPSKPALAPFHQEKSKQFWLTLHVPSDATPGAYTGTLTLSSTNGAAKMIRLDVTVWPITLETPKQNFLIYYDGNLSSDDANTKTETQMRAELQDIYEHGFTGIRIAERDISGGSLDRMYQLIQNQGFTGPFVYSTPSDLAVSLSPFLNVAKKYGITPYFYGLDEPTSDSEMALQIRSSFNIHTQNGRVVTAITKQQADALRDPSSRVYDLTDPLTYQSFRSENITHETLDLANYHITSLTDETTEIDPRDQTLIDYIMGLRNGSITKNPGLEYYYWQSWIQKPQINRLLSGFFLWDSHLDGIFPYTYEKISQATGDPFDDLDQLDQSPQYREFMTVYPGNPNPIPTTQWEAMREGIDDIRYLTTLFDLLDKLKLRNPALAGQFEAKVNTDLEKYLDTSLYADSETHALDFINSRTLIANTILQAQHALSMN